MKKFNWLIVSLLLVGSCEFKITTARLSNVQVCGSYDDKHGCLDDFTVFSSLPDTVFVSARLTNAPKNTEVRYYWYQILEDEELFIDSLSYFNTHNTELIYAHFTTNGKPLGKYKVTARVVADNQKPITKEYELAFPDETTIHMVRIGNERDEQTKRVTQLTRSFTIADSDVFFSTKIYNLSPFEEIAIYYEHADSGEIIDEVHLNAGETPDQVSMLNSNLPINSELNTGNYRIYVVAGAAKKYVDFVLN